MINSEINWSVTKRENDVTVNCDDGFIMVETIYEKGYNKGYYINVRHGAGFDGHYICLIRDGKIVGEGDCPEGGDEGPIDRPADVIQVISKCYSKLPDEYSLVLKDVYKL